MKVYFARHGESTANTLHVFSNRLANHPLTEKGREQALDLAHQLSLTTFSAIYTSPILRAAETTRIVCNHLQLPFIIHDGLREFDVGVFEGQSDEKYWQEFSELWKAWYLYGMVNKKIEGGESLVEIRRRLGDFLTEIVLQFKTLDANVLCITHGGLLYAAIPGLVDNITYSFLLENQLSNTASVVIEWNGKNWICLQWADTTLMG